MLLPLQSLMFPIQYLEVCDALIRAQDGDLAELHRRCAVSTQDLLEMTAVINGEQLLTAFIVAQEYCAPDRPAVLQILEHFPLTAHGMLGMLALASRTLGDAMNAALEFFPLMMPAFTVTKQSIGTETHLLFERRTDFGSQNAFFTELVMTVLHKIMVFMQIPIRSVQVYFSHPAAMQNIAPYEDAMAIKFYFDAKQNIIIIPRSALDIPLTTQSPTLHHMLEKSLRERMARAEYLTSVSHRVKRLIRLYLDENRVINGDVIAEALNLSRRTLARRLAEEGSPLPLLQNEVCIEYAEELLKLSHKSIAEIAYKVGFSNAANFSRTFKRITGKTPSHLRAEVK